MCALINANPGGIVQDFVPFCEVIDSFVVNPPDELKKKIVSVNIEPIIMIPISY